MSDLGGFTAADRRRGPRFDEIGYWSEIKLDILREYASAYSRVLHSQVARGKLKSFAYIDAFAGAGVHISKSTGEAVLGSPLNALLTKPRFHHHFFIDINNEKAEELRAAVGERNDVEVLEGDCNELLLARVFPRVRFEDYRRALCLLDPYALHLSWEVIRTAGEMRSIDMFLNFPVMDMNRNVLWRNPERVDVADAARLTRYWGDESWRECAYRKVPDLFDPSKLEKVTEANAAMAEAFSQRLRSAGGFANVPKPLAMRNSIGATVYYLFFASQKAVANDIVEDIFRKYTYRGDTRGTNH